MEEYERLASDVNYNLIAAIMGPLRFIDVWFLCSFWSGSDVRYHGCKVDKLITPCPVYKKGSKNIAHIDVNTSPPV